jgi:N-acyl homoserine lactone hydrolase
MKKYLALVAAVLAGCAGAPAKKTAAVDKMYVFACGESHVPDLSAYMPGVTEKRSAIFSDNCYLIKHGGEWMIWDTGHSDKIALLKDGAKGPRSTAFVKRTLIRQLNEIGVKPDQVGHLAWSHTHADHVGNANLFTAATVYIQKPEYDAAFGPDPGKFNFKPELYGNLAKNKIVQLQGDHDVFGDGSVTILSTPGHTPGHQSLLVRLAKTGAVVLTGDAAHFRENFEKRRVPAFNFNADQSRASMEKLARVADEEHARLWINHDSSTSQSIPHAPDFVE